MVKLVENCKFTSAVIYGSKRDATDSTAISEYARFMRFCVNKEDQPFLAKESDEYKAFVYIGADNDRAEARGIRVPRESFEEDTVYILVKDNFVLIDGGKRGKLYGNFFHNTK